MSEERLCLVCPVRNRRPVHYERAQVCQPCRVWLAEAVSAIGTDYAELHDRYRAHTDRPWTVRQLHKGHWVDAPGHDPVSAKLPTGAPGRTPPKMGLITGSRGDTEPIDLDLVDLTDDAGQRALSEDGRAWLVDQTGHSSIAHQLNQWVRDWMSYDWCHSDVAPDPNVPDLAAWLTRWADTACDEHPAIDDFADEISELHATMRGYIPRMVGKDEPPPRRRAEPRTAPCRGCDMMSLWWFPSDERVRCDNCDVVMTESEYASWARLVIAGEKARTA